MTSTADLIYRERINGKRHPIKLWLFFYTAPTPAFNPFGSFWSHIWKVCYTRLYHLRELFKIMDRAECVCLRQINELLKYKLYIYILMSTQRCSFCYWLFTMNNSTYRVALHQQCNGVSQNDRDGEIQSITSKMWTLLLDCSENVFEINRCFSSESV